MKLYFIRHGQTDPNKEDRVQGQEIDAPLNDTGIQQIKEAAGNLPEGIDLIISSPLRRAYQTAEIINEKLKLPLLVDDRLKELKYGTLAGKNWQEIEAETGDPSLHQRDITATFDYRPYGGESIEDVQHRAAEFVKDIQARYPGKTLLIASHGGVIDATRLIFGAQEIAEPAANGRLYQFVLED